MNKTLTIRQFATIKRVAQNVNPLVVKKNKIADKIKELNAEYNALSEEIEGHEMGVKNLTGGFMSEDLVIKVVEETGKVDKNGVPTKITKYEPNSERVSYDETNKVYIIKDEVEVDTLEGEIDDTETPDMKVVEDGLIDIVVK